MTSEVGNAVRKLYDVDHDRDAYEGVALQVDGLWDMAQRARVQVQPTTHHIETVGESRDLQAIQIIEQALFGVLNTDAARRRVMNFVIDTLDERGGQ